ncbi:MAG: hypothetical protein DDT26_01515 [Dehalococcoidia bacterium]|nr:hypothetical protein [Chloroflexota bacterium]MBT9166672.1 hypothetical protein [Chloroflexota bacterium]
MDTRSRGAALLALRLLLEVNDHESLAQAKDIVDLLLQETGTAYAKARVDLPPFLARASHAQ